MLIGLNDTEVIPRGRPNHHERPSLAIENFSKVRFSKNTPFQDKQGKSKLMQN